MMGRLQILRRHLEHNVPLNLVATEAGIPLRTIARWLSRYRANGPASLYRKSR